jgi:hypothetical protein
MGRRPLDPEERARRRRERQRALKRDINALMRRLELAPDGVRSILAAIDDGQRYIDIAADWLINESDVSDIAPPHGIRRHRRKPVDPPEARP